MDRGEVVIGAARVVSADERSFRRLSTGDTAPASLDSWALKLSGVVFRSTSRYSKRTAKSWLEVPL